MELRVVRADSGLIFDRRNSFFNFAAGRRKRRLSSQNRPYVITPRCAPSRGGLELSHARKKSPRVFSMMLRYATVRVTSLRRLPDVNEIWLPGGSLLGVASQLFQPCNFFNLDLDGVSVYGATKKPTSDLSCRAPREFACQRNHQRRNAAKALQRMRMHA